MILVKLFLTFFKIGLFTFGGGYGMIPLVQQEVTAKGWLEAETLYQYIGICESTPGPIAVNMATLIGSLQGGFWGSVCATVGVVLPAFIIMLLIAKVLQGFKDNRFVKSAMAGIQPVVSALITSTGIYVGLKCFLTNLSTLQAIGIDFRSVIIAALLAGGILLYTKVFKKKFSPILLILFSAAIGIAVYAF